MVDKIEHWFMEIPSDSPYEEILSKLAPDIMGKYVDDKYFDDSEEVKAEAEAHIASIFVAIKEKTALPISVSEQKTEEVKANLLSKIGALMGSSQKKPTPDFAEIFTKNEGLTRMVSEEEHWYNAYTTTKLSDQELYDNYCKASWIGEKTESYHKVYDLYHSSLAQLEKSYSR